MEAGTMFLIIKKTGKEIKGKAKRSYKLQAALIRDIVGSIYKFYL